MSRKSLNRFGPCPALDRCDRRTIRFSAASTRLLGVERLERRELLAVDFGDAPTPYPVTIAENGARHTDVGPTLGLSRDSEANGAHSGNSLADGADEDGVLFGTLRVGQIGASVTVNVQGGPAKLDAWIDFDSDGAWGGRGEKIADSLSVATGDNVITFDIPSEIPAGATYARFRVSTAGNLGVRGLAADGEVEDYLVTIQSPQPSPGIFRSEQPVSTANGPYSVAAVDLDGDGDIDTVTASMFDDKIAWQENDGSGNFAEHAISTIAGSVRSVDVADLDGDGDLDVVSAAYDNSAFEWYENNGSQVFAAHTISNTATAATFVQAADVDGDGDADVVGSTFGNGENFGVGQLYWYENLGSGNYAEHLIWIGGIWNFSLADIDGDSRLDVVAAALVSDSVPNVFIFSNSGGSFLVHPLGSEDFPSNALAIDLDNDGDVDVVTTATVGDNIVWFEHIGSGYSRHVISTLTDGPFDVDGADLDGDGDLDLVATSFNGNDVAVYENDGAQSFSRHLIATAFNGASSAAVADLDGDADLDIVAGAGSGGRFVWFENANPDWGDAPLPYPTLASQNGARHGAVGPTLGSTRDDEANGTPSSDALGDGSDEDGVTFGTLRVGLLGATVTVNVQGGAAKLDAWIDFNHDGNWDGSDEHVIDNVSVSVGNNGISFDVPGWAASGITYARFRLSTAGNLGPRGLASDGEVEDYRISLLPPVAASGTFSGPHLAGLPAVGAYSVVAADVDGDGDMDLVSASNGDNTVAWRENDGLGNFSAHAISTSSNGARAVDAVDFDGDGDVDILAASYFGDKVSWFVNDGNQAFAASDIVVESPTAVGAADVDGDGDLDMLIASSSANSIYWLENSPMGFVNGYTVTTNALNVRGVFAADMDRDGDLDLLSASSGDNRVAWYENNGAQVFTQHTMTTGAIGALSVFAADLDGDGDMDALSASVFDDTIAWYENDGFENFTPYVISSTAAQARSVYAADFDGDGDLDVLSASSYDDKLAWYVNNGGGVFSERIISSSPDAPLAIVAADVDGDGDLDAVSASYIDGQIAWYENKPVSQVLARRLFYNQSAFDGGSAAHGTADDAAIAPDKSAYLPNGSLASFANVSSYTRGINGIMIDLAGGGSHASINANDFIFKVGNDNAPSGWAAVTATPTISVRMGQGTLGSDRVTITWASGSIRNTWLEVQVLPTANTGLTAADVHFWGNKIGDTGQGTPATTFLTSGADKTSVLGLLGSGVGISSIRDFNRDNNVTAADASVVPGSLGSITRLNVGAGGPLAPEETQQLDGITFAVAAEHLSVLDCFQSAEVTSATLRSTVANVQTTIGDRAQHALLEQLGRAQSSDRRIDFTIDLDIPRQVVDDELIGLLIAGRRLGNRGELLRLPG